MEQKISKVIIVGIYKQGKEKECDISLDELERLTDTAGGEVVARVTQLKNSPEASTYIGSGKLEEIKDLCQKYEIDQIIFDTELSPAQIRNVEDATDTDVLDRSMLILDIFALHATSGEGKIQVELAQLKYTAPRLMGKGKDLSRLGGGIGTRGPGESKLETDRRKIAERIVSLQEELKIIEKNRSVMRAQREKSSIAKACILGYTNAGKSTLLNLLTGANILAEDKLFATLDPTTRKYVLPSGIEMLLTDTVGFIRNLPTHLIHAFRSTLEEAVCADFLIIVVDSSDEECFTQIAITENVIEQLGAQEKPRLYVFNKIDRCTNERNYDLRLYQSQFGHVVSISAQNGTGLFELLEQLETLCRVGKTHEKFLFPFADQFRIEQFYRLAEITKTEFTEEGTYFEAWVDEKAKGIFAKYIK